MKYKYYVLRFWPLYLITAVVCFFLTKGIDRAVTTMAENTPIPRTHTIVIDAGHGGEDGGATSCTGVLESHINLQIALRLNDLCHLLGYDTLMIRTKDISVYTQGNSIAAKKASDLRQRTHIVNSVDNAVLISIHQNFYPDFQYSGAQVFYAPTQGSKEFADILQSLFVSSVNPGSNRKSKLADKVFLMNHISCPGILVECGFLSNPGEEAKLRDEQYQTRLCCIIVSGLWQYINA